MKNPEQSTRDHDMQQSPPHQNYAIDFHENMGQKSSRVFTNFQNIDHVGQSNYGGKYEPNFNHGIINDDQTENRSINTH